MDCSLQFPQRHALAMTDNPPVIAIFRDQLCILVRALKLFAEVWHFDRFELSLDL